MKYIFFTFLITSLNVAAEIAEETINKVCTKQALALENDLKSYHLMDMTTLQSDELIRLSTEHCKRQFIQQNISETVAITNKDSVKEEKSNDWLTDYILNGETPDKPGNERLKRMQHK